jgi:hypothetical protein
MAKKPKSTKIKKQKNTANLDVNKDKLEETLKKQWVAKAIELMKDNRSSSFIREYIKGNKEGSKADTAIDTIMKEANALVTSSQFSRAEEIIPIHINRYNQNAKMLIEVKDILEDEVDGETITWEAFYAARNKKIKAYDDCINTLRQKEELKQYHNKDFVIEVNTEETIEIRETRNRRIQIEKLPYDEQVEMMEMMMESLQDENDLLAIVSKPEVEGEVTIDVEAEVVDVPNIQFIEHEKLPEPPKKSLVTAADPTVKLRESLQKLAASRFKAAGGTLTDDEESLIK